MRYYSYSGAGRGVDDPEQVHIVNVDEDMGYMVLVWVGEEYSRRNAWFMAENEDLVNLEENR